MKQGQTGSSRGYLTRWHRLHRNFCANTPCQFIPHANGTFNCFESSYEYQVGPLVSVNSWCVINIYYVSSKRISSYESMDVESAWKDLHVAAPSLSWPIFSEPCVHASTELVRSQTGTYKQACVIRKSMTSLLSAAFNAGKMISLYYINTYDEKLVMGFTAPRCNLILSHLFYFVVRLRYQVWQGVLYYYIYLILL